MKLPKDMRCTKLASFINFVHFADASSDSSKVVPWGLPAETHRGLVNYKRCGVLETLEKEILCSRCAHGADFPRGATLNCYYYGMASSRRCTREHVILYSGVALQETRYANGR
jgi:hypothetical protein